MVTHYKFSLALISISVHSVFEIGAKVFWLEKKSIFASSFYFIIGHLTQLVQSVTLTGWKSLVRVQ